VGHASASDAEILEFAAAQGYTLFTHDLDFGMLLAGLKTSGPSVLHFRPQSAKQCFVRFWPLKFP